MGESMENSSELLRLEEFVDNLLVKYRKLQKECVSLEKQLEERDLQCEKLKNTIEELRSERTVVGERVTGLIDRIEKWEQELETGEIIEGDDMEKLQGKLFQKGQATAK